MRTLTTITFVFFALALCVGGARAYEPSGGSEQYEGDAEAGTRLERQAVREFQERNHVEAARLFEQAWEVYQHPRYRFNAGQCYRHADRWREATVAYRQRLELEPPPSNYIYTNLGRCLLQLNQREEANAAFRRYLELEPNGDDAAQARHAIETGTWSAEEDPRPVAEVSAAREVHERAEQLVGQGQFQQAAEAYMEGYRQHSQIGELLFNGVLCYLWAGQVEPAIEAITQYLETPGADPEGWAMLAECRGAEGDLSAVLEAYRRYLQLAPDGACAEQARQVVRSLSLFDHMPTRQQVAEAKQHYERANQHARAGRHRRAIRAYLSAWEGMPSPTIRFNLGICYYRTNRLDEALTCFTQYMEQMGDEGQYASAHVNTAQVLADLDRNEEAMQHVRAYRRRAEEAELPRERYFLNWAREVDEQTKQD